MLCEYTTDSEAASPAHPDEPGAIGITGHDCPNEATHHLIVRDKMVSIIPLCGAHIEPMRDWLAGCSVKAELHEGLPVETE